MRKLVTTSFITVVMFAIACTGDMTSSDTGLGGKDIIYANDVTVTLDQNLTGVKDGVAPIPHFNTQTLALNTLKDVKANTTTANKHRVSVTATALESSLRKGGSMAHNVTIDVVGVYNNNKKATFTVIVKANSGYKFDNGVTDRFNIISEIKKNTGAWLNEIDMSKRTFTIAANRHVGGVGTYNLSFPATDTVFFKDGAIVPATIRLLIADMTATTTKSIPKSAIALATQNAIIEAINKDTSLNGKIDVTVVEKSFDAGEAATSAKLEVTVTIKSKNSDLYTLTGLKENGDTGIVTIEAAVLGTGAGTITAN